MLHEEVIYEHIKKLIQSGFVQWDLHQQQKPIVVALDRPQSDSASIADACEQWLELLQIPELDPYHHKLKAKLDHVGNDTEPLTLPTCWTSNLRPQHHHGNYEVTLGPSQRIEHQENNCRQQSSNPKSHAEAIKAKRAKREQQTKTSTTAGHMGVRLPRTTQAQPASHLSKNTKRRPCMTTAWAAAMPVVSESEGPLVWQMKLIVFKTSCKSIYTTVKVLPAS